MVISYTARENYCMYLSHAVWKSISGKGRVCLSPSECLGSMKPEKILNGKKNIELVKSYLLLIIESGMKIIFKWGKCLFISHSKVQDGSRLWKLILSNMLLSTHSVQYAKVGDMGIQTCLWWDRPSSYNTRQYENGPTGGRMIVSDVFCQALNSVSAIRVCVNMENFLVLFIWKMIFTKVSMS